MAKLVTWMSCNGDGVRGDYAAGGRRCTGKKVDIRCLPGDLVGNGIAQGTSRGTRLRVVDAILTGVHHSGESHFELLRAFADDALLAKTSADFIAYRYRAHEFGDSMCGSA